MSKSACLLVTALSVASLSAPGCSSRAAKYAGGPSCEERQVQLVEVVQALPEKTLSNPVSVPLPSSALSGAFGKGVVLELNEPLVLLNGAPITGQTQEERVAEVAQQVAALAPAAGEHRLRVYVAAASQMDIRSLNAYLSALASAHELRLMFARPALDPTAPEDDADDSVYAARVLTERDPAARRLIAAEGYDEYSDCPSVDRAVASLQTVPDATRWPRLKHAMVEAVPRCQCSDIDPDGLRNLLVAEQRAGSVALGSMPANFLRDTRCRASMPLRSVQQVLADVEDFEAEFSGTWDESGVRFEEVVTNERLLNYLCMAMPGEILEAVSRDFASLYIRTSKTPGCRALRFDPVARGAPFGTLRAEDERVASFHYRLGGNELRLFGPLPHEKSRPTDDGPWACDQDLKLSAVDETSIHVQSGGRLYLTQAACEAASPSEAQLTSCVFDPTLTPPQATEVSPTGDQSLPGPAATDPNATPIVDTIP